MEILAFPKLGIEAERKLKRFFKEIEVSPINEHVKEIAIQFKRNYAIKLPDAIIAATAFYKNIPLFSSDSDFERIEELSLIKWET